MDLLTDIRKLAAELPESAKPSLNELTSVVGALIAHAEHGESILKAAEQGAEAVAKLVAPEAAAAVTVLAPEVAPIADGAAAVIEQLPPVVVNQAAPQTPAVPQAPEPPAPPTVAAEVPPAFTPGDPVEIQRQIEALQTELAAAQRGVIETDPTAEASG